MGVQLSRQYDPDADDHRDSNTGQCDPSAYASHEVFDHDEAPPQYSPTSPGSPLEDKYENDGDDPMVGYLTGLGVSASHAKDSISSMRSTRAAVTLAQVYGGGATVDCANKTPLEETPLSRSPLSRSPNHEG